MNIRLGNKQDIPQLIPLADRFYADAELPGGVVPEIFQANWELWLENGFGVLVVAEEDGAIYGATGGLVVPAANDGKMEANELFWFLHPNYRSGGTGTEMFDAWEQACIDAGAVRIGMIRLHGPSGERIGQWLESRGYRPVEVHYYRDLEN